MNVRQLHQFIEAQMRKPASSQAFWFVFVSSPLSFLWEVVTTLRNLLFDTRVLRTRRLPGVTVAVGNLEMGGTGKSPLTGLLAKGFIAQGHWPVVLSRGYGIRIKKREVLWIQDGGLKASRSGQYDAGGGLPDEARMLSALCPGTPVLCAPNRWLAAQWFLSVLAANRQPSHWILDDGFQHRSLFRDHNIAVVDGARPYGNGWCLPRGSLREPMGGIWRSNVIVSSGVEPCAVGSSNIPTFALGIRSAHLKVPNTGDFGDWELARVKNVTLMTAIARPERVVETLREKLNVIPNALVFKADHAGFSRNEVEQSLAGGSQIVITEKDYWRHPDIWQAEQGRVLILVLDWHINETIWSVLLR